MISFSDPKLHYPQAQHACRVWGNWVRDGRPRCYVSIPGTLGNLDKREFGYGSTGEYFVAYGIDQDDPVARLVEDVVYGTQRRPALSVALGGLMCWYWVRIQYGNPLLYFPPGWTRKRAKKEAEEIGGQPILTVAHYAERFQMPKRTVYERLNRALKAVNELMLERATVQNDAVGLLGMAHELISDDICRARKKHENA